MMKLSKAFASNSRYLSALLLAAVTFGCMSVRTERNPNGATVILGGRMLDAARHVIVLPEEPTPTEATAAGELARILGEMTGTSLETCAADSIAGRFPIFIGRNARLADYGFKVDYGKLGTEGIHIQGDGRALVLGGGRRGALYAVYDFLEEHCGCRWYAVDCNVFPKKGVFAIGKISKVYVPQLCNRNTDYPCSRPLREFAVPNKINGTYIPRAEEWGNAVTYAKGNLVHTFNVLVPPDKYGNEHPEYFSEIGGRRISFLQFSHSQ